VATIRKNIEGQIKLAAERYKEVQDLTWSQILERGYVVAGSPDTVVDQLKDMESRLRIGHLMVLLHFGDMPKETVTYNSTRFAQEIAPRLRSIGGEWEDRWWPRGTLPQLAEPAPLRSATGV
jgi:alkanesulfonate monooxygenase SsuD/methylene tetrahydromethanopterin reductase-like flavin-dependent oxidoreductase (luciferase family)